MLWRLARAAHDLAAELTDSSAKKSLTYEACVMLCMYLSVFMCPWGMCDVVYIYIYIYIYIYVYKVCVVLLTCLCIYIYGCIYVWCVYECIYLLGLISSLLSIMFPFLLWKLVLFQGYEAAKRAVELDGNNFACHKVEASACASECSAAFTLLSLSLALSLSLSLNPHTYVSMVSLLSNLLPYGSGWLFCSATLVTTREQRKNSAVL